MSRVLYFNAIAKHGLLTKGTLAALGVTVTPYHFALTGFWVLVYMWLKVGDEMDPTSSASKISRGCTGCTAHRGNALCADRLVGDGVHVVEVGDEVGADQCRDLRCWCTCG